MRKFSGIILCICLIVCTTMIFADAADTNKAQYDELSLNDYEWEVLRLCNIERAKEGLNSLSMIGTLQTSCDIREKEIASVFSHTRPNGEDCYSALPSTFQWNAAGENIAMGQPTPEVVVEAWMNSEGHRANILNDEYNYMGVGYNSNGHYWVQYFASSKNITSVVCSSSKTEFTESEAIENYFTITTSNGYLSYMPVDFASMKKIGNEYTPRLDASRLPAFKMLEETVSSKEESTKEESKPTETVTTTPGANKIGTTTGSIFEKYIPIAQVYGSEFSVGLNMTPGKVERFSIGTQFNDETEYGAGKIKRSDYQNHFVKLNYVGTYATADKTTVLTHLNLYKPEEYEKVIKGQPSDWAKAYNITKDTIIVSIDLYDANKKFVRNIAPACFIAATADDGSFITYSVFYNLTSAIYFSQSDNLFQPDEDRRNSLKSLTITTTNLMVSDKSVAENLLTPVVQEAYDFIKYPELTGTRQYNTNHILDDDEFVTPDMTYYQVTDEFKKIDPVIKHEIKNVVSYSYYLHSLGSGYTQRNIVTSDSTLYGVSSSYEKKQIATNVKKTTANHYLTKDGTVKELNGKVVATDCVDFEESNDGWVIGIIKKDGSFYMGYTFIENGDGYARGIKKMLDNAKYVVPNGVFDKNNTFYRWDNKITASGIDMNAFFSGKVVQSYTLELNLIQVCNNAERVFPYEYLTKVNATDEEVRKQNIYGFVQDKNGTLHGYSTTYHQSFGSYGKIERIFPVYTGTSLQEGNFVGIKVQNEPTPYAIVCRYCDSNTYRWGKLVTEQNTPAAAFVCETMGGYYAEDGKVYGTDANPPNSHQKNTAILCATNVITNLPQMYRGTATYRAYRRDTDKNIPLLPSVYTWSFDNKGIILLERTDGSVWMANVISPSSAADLVSKAGGYESSNVFQVSKATTTKRNTEYINTNDVDATAKFKDVKSTAWYSDAVNWAVDKGITTGTSETTFSPDSTCTRAQILTFLWRAVGSPKASTKNPFSDVKSGDYFYDAAIWAYSKGMVTGTKFEGNTPCTRSATVIYLYKNASSPKVSYNNTFTDVKSNAEYTSAVAWAVDKGITTGTSPTTFSPDTTCTRGQIVTFLNRALK